MRFRNLALVDLLFATGMRVGEASTLNVQDFTPSESVFRIKGKGGRDRLAYLVDEQTVHIQLKHFEKAITDCHEPSGALLKLDGRTSLNTKHGQHYWQMSSSRRHRPSHNSAHASTHCRYAAATERHGHQSGPGVSRTRFNCHYAEVYAYSKGTLNRRVEKTASFTVTAGASLITIRHLSALDLLHQEFAVAVCHQTVHTARRSESSTKSGPRRGNVEICGG